MRLTDIVSLFGFLFKARESHSSVLFNNLKLSYGLFCKGGFRTFHIARNLMTWVTCNSLAASLAEGVPNLVRASRVG